jgi:hypothetical protein
MSDNDDMSHFENVQPANSNPLVLEYRLAHSTSVILYLSNVRHPFSLTRYEVSEMNTIVFSIVDCDEADGNA